MKKKSSILRKCLLPVSYTHLDVYKRQLELNMARILDIFFNIHGIIRKSIDRFRLRYLKIFCKIFPATGNTHSFSTAATGCLDHNRKTNLLCQFQTISSSID